MPAAKVQHFDSDYVRRYITKQRADREHKLLEEKESQRKANENKQRQLQEFYKQQKETARVPVDVNQSQHPILSAVAVERDDRKKLDSTFTPQDERVTSKTAANKVRHMFCFNMFKVQERLFS